MVAKLESEAPSPQSGLSRTIRILGVVSLCTDLANKMVYPITPIFLTVVLGAPAWSVGVIAGIAESAASLLKLYSGWLSDRVGQRKLFAVTGYGLGAISKLALALATAWGYVLGARLIDRVGKGLRAAPRDALIAENCLPEQRGRAFGLHHSLETIGEIIGPLLGFLILRQFVDDYRRVFTIAFLPALLGVLILIALVKEPEVENAKPRDLPQYAFQGLSPSYRQFLLVVVLFGLGNSSDVFLLLRAQDLGFQGLQLLLLYTAFNGVEACFSFAAGNLSDRIGRRPLLISGYLVFAIVYAGFAIAQNTLTVWLLFMLYGLYSTLTRGVQKAWVADLVNPERRGAEIGTFYMLVGLVALPASLLAGWLYTAIAASAPFYISAATALLAALLLLTVKEQMQSINEP